MHVFPLLAYAHVASQANRGHNRPRGQWFTPPIVQRPTPSPVHSSVTTLPPPSSHPHHRPLRAIAQHNFVVLSACWGDRSPTAALQWRAPAGTTAPPARTSPAPDRVPLDCSDSTPYRGADRPTAARGSRAPAGTTAPPPRTPPGSYRATPDC